MASSSAHAVTHPPRSNPPLRSSSGPPSPCITPSTVTIVRVVSFMGSSFLSWWSFSFDRTEARISSVERGSVLQVHSASFPNLLLVHRDPRQVAALACQFVPEARVFLLALKQLLPGRLPLLARPDPVISDRLPVSQTPVSTWTGMTSATV